MAVTKAELIQAVEAENERLNKIDVEKVRIRLQEISGLRKQQAANLTAAHKQNEKLEESIQRIQKEVTELEFNEVSITDLVPNADATE